MSPDTSPLAPLRGAVLIGGAGERMGQPKQLLLLDGEPFLARVVRALQPHVEQIHAVGTGPVPEQHESLPRIADAEGAAGPLGGILGALRAFPAAAWLVAACDLPLLTDAAVAWLVAQRESGHAAVIPRIDDQGVEPLLAIYEPQALSLLEGLLREGRRAPRHLARLPGVDCPSVPESLRVCWTNVNRPQELSALTSS